MLIIKNDYLLVDIATKGAEVRRVTSIDGAITYMWNGDPKIWNGISPVLFPHVGRAVNDKIVHKGASFNMPKHGFARHSEFIVYSHTKDKIKLQLDPNNLVEEKYPFNLNFYITYSLFENQLLTKYEVENLSGETAYFSVGAHPAFNCPFDDKHILSDYMLKFSSSEELIEYHLTNDGFFSGVTSTRILAGESIQLNEQIFANDALVFSGYKSESVSLVEKVSNRKITVSLVDFPMLGFWAKPGKAGYVCIEPWCGRADDFNFNAELKDKANIIEILADKNWSNTYSIKFDY